MSNRRTLSRDAATGITTDFIFEAGETASQDTFVIAKSQDVTALVEQNKVARNEIDKHHRHGEFSKIASIPLSIYYDLKQRGIIDDQKAMRAWLNDPDNRAFRTRDARI